MYRILSIHAHHLLSTPYPLLSSLYCCNAVTVAPTTARTVAENVTAKL